MCSYFVVNMYMYAHLDMLRFEHLFQYPELIYNSKRIALVTL